MHQAALVLVLVAATLMALKSNALRCYDGRHANRVVANCTSCSFCAIALSVDRHVSQKAPLSYMAVDESALDDDHAASLREMLRVKSEDYKVLSTCMIESYDFSMYMRKPLKIELFKPEVILRCFCNSDLCNEARTVADFWSSLSRMETGAVRERLYKKAAQQALDEALLAFDV